MAISHIVHELIPFLAPLGGQNIIWIVSNLRVSTLSKSIACSQNWGILPQIQKWMLQTAEKADEQNGLLV